MPRIAMERSGEMEVFARVVQEGGFSAAARTLDLTPSAVSKLIARLEARLGVRLLVRTTRALSLTDEGEAYHRAAMRVLHEMNQAEQQASGGAVRGRLRVSASVPFGTMFVAPAVTRFLAQHPQVTVDLSLTDDVVDLLAQRTDVAIRTGTLPDSALVARRLGQSRLVVCASPDYLARYGVPRRPEDLADHDCLTFNFRRAPAAWPFRRDGDMIEQPVSGSLQLNNGETMRQMALAGAGVARLGLFHVAEHIAAGRLVALLEADNPGDLENISAIYVGGGMVPHRVRMFIDHLVAELKGSPLLAGGV